VLGTLFYRFISENLTDYINKLQKDAGVDGFDYAELSDEEAESARQQMVEEKGFFILPSQLFQNVCKTCTDDDNLNMTLSKIFTAIEGSAMGTESEDDMKGLFSDFNVDSTQLGGDVKTRNKLISKVLLKVRDMDLGDDFQDNKIDAFGDAYEFLMTMYASNAGKSGGEFFTPQEVSELLARLTAADGHTIRSVYDPACGSGSLLLKFSKTIGKENPALKYYGQEINPTTYNLCRINMFLHNINYDNRHLAESLAPRLRAFRCHRKQSALQHPVGRLQESFVHQRRPLCRPGRVGARQHGRPCLHASHAALVERERNGCHR